MKTLVRYFHPLNVIFYMDYYQLTASLKLLFIIPNIAVRLSKEIFMSVLYEFRKCLTKTIFI